MTLKQFAKLSGINIVECGKEWEENMDISVLTILILQTVDTKHIKNLIRLDFTDTFGESTKVLMQLLKE